MKDKDSSKHVNKQTHKKSKGIKFYNKKKP